MSDDELKKKSNSLNNIDVGDMVESLSTGRLGLVRNIVFADGEHVRKRGAASEDTDSVVCDR